MSVFVCVWRSVISNLCGIIYDFGKINLISDDFGEFRIVVVQCIDSNVGCEVEIFLVFNIVDI